MKSFIIFLISVIIAASPLFKGIYFPYEKYIVFSLLMLLCLLYSYYKYLHKEKFALNNYCFLAGVMLILSYCLAFIKAVNVRGNIEVTIQYLVYFLIFIVIYDYLRFNIEKIQLFFLMPFYGVSFLAAVIGLIGYTGAIPLLNDTIYDFRLGSTFQYTNTAAIYFLINIIFIISMMILTENILLKIFMAGTANIIFLALFFTGSRGVFLVIPLVIILAFIFMPASVRLKSIMYFLCIALPIIIATNGYEANAKIMNLTSALKWVLLSAFIAGAFAFTVSLLYRFKIPKKIGYITIGVTITTVLALLISKLVISSLSIPAFFAEKLPKNIIGRLLDINLKTQSVTGRFELYKDAIKLIKGNWLFGLGGGGFTSLYQSVQDVYYASSLVHNHYLQVFVEAGVIGFIAFALLTIFTLQNFLGSYIKQDNEKHRIMIAACFCGFTALAVHSMIDFNLSYSAMSLTYWYLIGISAAFFNLSRNADYGKHEYGLKGGAFAVFISVLCLSILILGIRLGISSYYAYNGAEAKRNIKPDTAIRYYTKAVRLDSLNANHHAELADLYSWMAYSSKTEKIKKDWLAKAVTEGETAINLDRYYPYYNKILTDIYFNSDQSIKAYEQADKLVKLQPKVNTNYELLVKGYLEAGLKYLRDRDNNKGADLIKKCAHIDENYNIQVTPTIAFYKGKALLLLKDFSSAEVLLNYARTGSLELKMESDRLIYVINEETGKREENSKYKGVPWMGMVTRTPAYKEVRSILETDALAGK